LGSVEKEERRLSRHVGGTISTAQIFSTPKKSPAAPSNPTSAVSSKLPGTPHPAKLAPRSVEPRAAPSFPRTPIPPKTATHKNFDQHVAFKRGEVDETPIVAHNESAVKKAIEDEERRMKRLFGTRSTPNTPS
jgi:hypothetical protein